MVFRKWDSSSSVHDHEGGNQAGVQRDILFLRTLGATWSREEPMPGYLYVVARPPGSLSCLSFVLLLSRPSQHDDIPRGPYGTPYRAFSPLPLFTRKVPAWGRLSEAGAGVRLSGDSR